MRLGLLLLVSVMSCTDKAATKVRVGMAASLRSVAPELAAAFGERRPDVEVLVQFGASGELRRQVERDRRLDAVVLASAESVDGLIDAGIADPTTREVVATNALVLVGPQGAAPIRFADLGSMGPSDRLAVGDPASVPAGQYARDLLVREGHWDALQGRLTYGGDVTAVLAHARRGTVRAAIVYKTDALGVGDVTVFDESPWPRPEIVSVVLKDRAGSTPARDFLAFVASSRGREIFAKHGFGAPAPGGAR